MSEVEYKFIVRKATKHDVEAIADLSSAMNQSEGMTEWHRPDTKVLCDNLDEVDIYLAEEDRRAIGLIAGFRHFNPHNSYFRFVVSSFFVSPEHRRKGVGKRLLNTLIQGKEKENIRQFAVDTMPFNKDACALLEKMGFELKDIAFNNYRLGFEKLDQFYKKAS
jgi:L-amino acid N-acyltransferase YncA